MPRCINGDEYQDGDTLQFVEGTILTDVQIVRITTDGNVIIRWRENGNYEYTFSVDGVYGRDSGFGKYSLAHNLTRPKQRNSITKALKDFAAREIVCPY